MNFLTNEEIGKVIRNRREKLNMTQRQLGEKLNVGAAAVNKWELGRVANIKREVLRNLAIVLNLNPAILIGIDTEEKEIIIRDTEFSDSEMTDIQNYIEFVKTKRGNN